MGFLHLVRPGQQQGPLEPGVPADFRLAAAAAAAWAAAAAATRLPAGAAWTWALGLSCGAVLVAVLALARCGRTFRHFLVPLLLPLGAGCLVFLAAAGSLARFTAGPVDEAARAGQVVTVVLRISSDAAPVASDAFSGEGRYVLRATVTAGIRSGRSFRAAAPVTVLGGEQWERIGRGDTVRVVGSLRIPSRQGKEVALVLPAAAPTIEPAGGGEDYARDLRQQFTARASARGIDDGGLLPGMAIGDRRGLDAALAEAMKATGLSHLTAVSGANCTYVLAFAFLACRAARMPRFVAAGAALCALAAFVVLVRPEPSVLRAAVMGAIGVFAVLSGRGRLSLSLLFLAVIVLLAADPWLHSSYAFVLSVTATGGLILAGPLLASRFAGFLPLWLAQLLAVPVTAQLVCTPVLILLQPALPVYAVPANVAAAPVVPLVTIAGLLAVAGLAVLPPAVEPLLAVGQAGSWWVAAVARVGSSVPFGQLPWVPGLPGALLAAALSTAVVLALLRSGIPQDRQRSDGGRPGRRRRRALLCLAGGCALGLAGLFLTTFERREPSGGWALAACDVGQGDAFVVNAGAGHAVVIDAGPDPDAVDSCLADLSVRVIDLLVISHLHEDHYGGAAGVFAGREVKELRYSSGEPALPRGLAGLARSARLDPARITAGDAGRAGGIRWHALWPAAPESAGGAGIDALPGAEPMSENDSSAVLLVEIPSRNRAVTVLFTGDIEADASRRLLGRHPELEESGVDILKIPHHGARNGGTAIFGAVRPGLALLSSGEGNDYGHPHPQVVAGLREMAIHTARTDRLGTFTVSIPVGALEVRSLR